VGMWAAWGALRVGWHWLIIAAAGALLCWTVWYQHGRDAAAVPLFVVAALLLVARLTQRSLAREAFARGLPSAPTSLGMRLTRVGVAAAGASALVFVAWLLPPLHLRANIAWQPPRPPQAVDPGLVIRPQVRQTELHDFGSVLPFTGAIALGDAPVANVQAQQPGLLFGVAYDRYEDIGWTSSATNLPPRSAAASAPAALPGDRLAFQGGSAASTGAGSISVRVAQPAKVLLASGPPLAAVAPPGASLSYVPQQLKGSPPDEFSALYAVAPLQPGGSYTTSASVASAAPAALRSEGAALPDWVAQNYVQLPAALPQRVRDLAARIAAGEPTAYDKALAVQQYLRGMTYDESIAAPPPGEDGVDYLLFVTGRGYCDYFASAMAVMLRSLGVPARVVAGYAMHEQNASGGFVVREHDAHAWTEVYFPGYGWQPFDPTPGGAGIALQGTPALAAAAATPVPVGTDAAHVAASAAAQPAATVAAPAAGSAARTRHTGGSRLALLWLLIGVAAAVGLALLALRLAGRRVTPRGAALLAWGVAAAAAGVLHRRRRPTETAPEYARDIARQNGSTAGLRALARAYSHARFAAPDAALPAEAGLRRRTLATVAALAWGRLRPVRGGRR
ncbi:MAG TPA: transglutaminase-like domain-containing protein, partial [Dehalococcoidia bacterium]|nr:transglutaminase-like domain-containing protein [Dehalococcoidia bacterium]